MRGERDAPRRARIRDLGGGRHLRSRRVVQFDVPDARRARGLRRLRRHRDGALAARLDRQPDDPLRGARQSLVDGGQREGPRHGPVQPRLRALGRLRLHRRAGLRRQGPPRVGVQRGVARLPRGRPLALHGQQNVRHLHAGRRLRAALPAQLRRHREFLRLQLHLQRHLPHREPRPLHGLREHVEGRPDRLRGLLPQHDLLGQHGLGIQLPHRLQQLLRQQFLLSLRGLRLDRLDRAEPAGQGRDVPFGQPAPRGGPRHGPRRAT